MDLTLFWNDVLFERTPAYSGALYPRRHLYVCFDDVTTSTPHME
jgi:hypothetical protein